MARVRNLGMTASEELVSLFGRVDEMLSEIAAGNTRGLPPCVVGLLEGLETDEVVDALGNLVQIGYLGWLAEESAFAPLNLTVPIRGAHLYAPCRQSRSATRSPRAMSSTTEATSGAR